MPIAATSREAYHDHRDSGKMSKQESRIFEFLQGYPNGLTRRQIAQRTGLDLSAVCGRVNSLVSAELLREFPGGKCPITGRRAKWVAPMPKQGELGFVA